MHQILSVLIVLVAASCSGGKGSDNQLPLADASAHAPDASENCPSDFTTAEGTVCSEEGQSCSSGNCSDQCSFCNLLRCENGVWSRLEAFPLPCFSCDTAQCVTGEEFCQLDHTGAGLEGACFDAATEPSTQKFCTDSPSCDCLMESGIQFDSCEEANPGEVVIQILGD